MLSGLFLFHHTSVTLDLGPARTTKRLHMKMLNQCPVDSRLDAQAAVTVRSESRKRMFLLGETLRQHNHPQSTVSYVKEDFPLLSSQKKAGQLPTNDNRRSRGDCFDGCEVPGQLIRGASGQYLHPLFPRSREEVLCSCRTGDGFRLLCRECAGCANPLTGLVEHVGHGACSRTWPLLRILPVAANPIGRTFARLVIELRLAITAYWLDQWCAKMLPNELSHSRRREFGRTSEPVAKRYSITNSALQTELAISFRRFILQGIVRLLSSIHCENRSSKCAS